MKARWMDGGAAAPPMEPAAPATERGLDDELRAAAELSLEEHWALRSLRRERRAQILAVATAAAPGAAAAAGDGEGAAAPLPRARRSRAARLPVGDTAPDHRRDGASGVTAADVMHLAGAYDLAGRDAIALLDALLAAEPATTTSEPGEVRPSPAALVERRGLQRGAVEAQLVVAAGRAFTLLAALPLYGTDATTRLDADAPAPGADGAAAAEAAEAEADPRADERVLHRVLHLAALAEIGRRRADWERWLARHHAALAARPCAAPVLAVARGLPAPAPDGGSAWDVRFRALVVAAWLAVLPRSGPSGLDEAMELLGRLREERAARERAWMEGLAGGVDGERAVVRARFALFALGHLADAAVETLLFLRHGPAYAEARTVDHVVDMRLHLAREAAAGDLQWDALLVWLREAVRLVIARRTSQLEMAVGA